MGLGSILGELAGKAAVQCQEINQYKKEYESISTEQLKAEYKAIPYSCYGTERKLREMAIKLVIQDRGEELSKLKH